MKRILHTFFLVLLLLNSALHAFEKNSAQNKKVFLTGAAGFIGSNCLKYLFDKYPDYEFVVLDALTYAGNLENIKNPSKSANSGSEAVENGERL